MSKYKPIRRYSYNILGILGGSLLETSLPEVYEVRRRLEGEVEFYKEEAEALRLYIRDVLENRKSRKDEDMVDYADRSAYLERCLNDAQMEIEEWKNASGLPRPLEGDVTPEDLEFEIKCLRSGVTGLKKREALLKSVIRSIADFEDKLGG